MVVMTGLLALVGPAMVKKLLNNLHRRHHDSHNNSNSQIQSHNDDNNHDDDNKGTKAGLTVKHPASTPLSPTSSSNLPGSGQGEGRGGEVEMTLTSSSPTSSSSFSGSGAATAPRSGLAQPSAQTQGLAPPRLGGARRPSNVSQNPPSAQLLDGTSGAPVEVAHMALANRWHTYSMHPL